MARSAPTTLGVIGLGYVGLAVAIHAAMRGHRVIGYDVSEQRVKCIQGGQFPFKGSEPGMQEAFDRALNEKRVVATHNLNDLAEAPIKLVAVQTPVTGGNHAPDLTFLITATIAAASCMVSGDLLIIESTLPPGTMERVIRPLVFTELHDRRGIVDYSLACCPERVNPGRMLDHLRRMPRVLGVEDAMSERRALEFYSGLVDASVDTTDFTTAELVKTVENAYRDVNIAFANTVALLCEEYGSDVWAVRELVNKCEARAMHRPGPGVGGHCIPKDPWLLIAQSKEMAATALIRTARETNVKMPHIVISRIETWANAHKLPNPSVLVLGLAYKEDTDDTRDSPSLVVIEAALARGWGVSAHDPHVEPSFPLGGAQRIGALEGTYDVVLLLVAHQEYLDGGISALTSKFFLDTRGVFESSNPPLKTDAAGTLGVSR